MKPRIGMICLGVRDLGRALEFYHRGLGFPLHNHAEGDQHIMFRLEGSWLSLFPRDGLAADAGVRPSGPGGFAGFTLAHNVGSPETVDAVFRQALGAGAKSIKTPRPASWGGYSGYFADPDGFLWEVAYNPFKDLS